MPLVGFVAAKDKPVSNVNQRAFPVHRCVTLNSYFSFVSHFNRSTVSFERSIFIVFLRSTICGLRTRNRNRSMNNRGSCIGGTRASEIISSEGLICDSRGSCYALRRNGKLNNFIGNEARRGEG